MLETNEKIAKSIVEDGRKKPTEQAFCARKDGWGCWKVVVENVLFFLIKLFKCEFSVEKKE